MVILTFSELYYKSIENYVTLVKTKSYNQIDFTMIDT
jgi:hypothetical protein